MEDAPAWTAELETLQTVLSRMGKDRVERMIEEMIEDDEPAEQIMIIRITSGSDHMQSHW